MKTFATIFCAFTLLLFIEHANCHARLWEPASRATMWRKDYPNPPDYNDNQGFCGGFDHQFNVMGGKCGICGDAYDDKPRQHEAPGGQYANGIIVRSYKPGQVIDVEIEITSNHLGHMEFKLCPNNNPSQDPGQDCFDKHVLRTYPDNKPTYKIVEGMGIVKLQLQLPADIKCSQCILQWTYIAGNNWGYCSSGEGALGCGNQEHFRACSDIEISENPKTSSKPVTTHKTGFKQNSKSPVQAFKPVSKKSCTGVAPYDKIKGISEWCVEVCNHSSPFCPTSHCLCH